MKVNVVFYLLIPPTRDIVLPSIPVILPIYELYLLEFNPSDCMAFVMLFADDGKKNLKRAFTNNSIWRVSGNIIGNRACEGSPVFCGISEERSFDGS